MQRMITLASAPAGGNADQQLVLAERFLPAARRLHVTELGWLERIRAARLFAYRFDPVPFNRLSHVGQPPRIDGAAGDGPESRRRDTG